MALVPRYIFYYLAGLVFTYLYFCRKRSRGITLSIQFDRSPWKIGIHLQGTSYFIGEILPRNHERRTMLSDSRKSLGLHELQTEDYQTLKDRLFNCASYCLTWVALSWKPLFTLLFCCWLFTFSPKLWSTKCLISNNKILQEAWVIFFMATFWWKLKSHVATSTGELFVVLIHYLKNIKVFCKCQVSPTHRFARFGGGWWRSSATWIFELPSSVIFEAGCLSDATTVFCIKVKKLADLRYKVFLAISKNHVEVWRAWVNASVHTAWNNEKVQQYPTYQGTFADNFLPVQIDCFRMPF